MVSGTLFRPDSSVSAVGSVSFISLHFVKAASGSGTLDFDTSSTSTVSEQIIDADGNLVSASFGPGHGGTLLVP